MDVEEGEISDTASVEEITEKDFVVKPGAKTVPNSNPDPTPAPIPNPNPKPRVWTMRDLYNYQNKYQSRGNNYASGLYNLAWAQAVQNKPLDEVFVMEVKDSQPGAANDDGAEDSSNKLVDSKDSDSSKVVTDVSGDEEAERAKVEVAGEKEEGELEEGEIDFYSGDPKNDDMDADKLGNEVEERVKSIREGIGSVTWSNAEKSYEEVCSRLQNSLDSLQEMVFCSMNQNEKDQSRDILARLLAHVTSQKPPLFTHEKMKEIEVMTLSEETKVLSSSTKDNHMEEKEIEVKERVNRDDSDVSVQIGNQDISSLKKCVFDSTSVESMNHNDPRVLLESLKMGVASSKGRGMLLPLLDLHKDHDVDTLPSPTREIPSCLPVDKALTVGGGVVRPEYPGPREDLETGRVVMHPYETDAVKAVSTYQQKFGRNSFFMTNRLPSPTPSEEGGDGDGDTDTGGEVSSVSIVRNANSVNGPTFAQSIGFSVPQMDIACGQGLINLRNASSASSGSNSMSRPAKSRDPRLRGANSDVLALDLNQRPLHVVNNELKVEPLGGITSSRKQKPGEEPFLDGPVRKRHKSEVKNSGFFADVGAVSGSGGWLEDRGTVGYQVTNQNHMVVNPGSDSMKLDDIMISSGTNSGWTNVATSDSERFPVTGANTTPSLHSLLKDIAVNPSMWMNLIKMEQQKSVEPLTSPLQPPSSNSILGAVPPTSVAPPKTSVAPSISLVLGQRSGGLLQTPQTALTDEKIRMKPRDPRRALHSNPLHKGGSLESDQSKTNASIAQVKDNLTSQKQEEQLDKKSVSSDSVIPPDIAHQFTKNLKNIASMMSVSQASLPPPAVSLIPSSQPVIPSSQPTQVHPSWVDIKGVLSESSHLQSGTGSASEEVAGPSQSQNSWGDVEHLFEGFDDQQRAAIQRERVRRIEEQKKMFAARKLCLVLDLDHTLLNSAKFVEIDPVHDELLRSKEEQDRDKSYRHLFRFPHMGMWTKLRPGIWNFLEKASKLFEMHLYTMGNKLYATEMAKVLDPKGVLFAGRVISKGDDGDLIDGKSKDLEGVLGMESAVVIIDDSVRVWPHNKLNLIAVERYIFFPCSRRQFGLPGPSLLEIDHDERSEDGTLASCLAVIERIHQNFFSHVSLDEADVRNILASVQRNILSGCRIVFSRVFPVGEIQPHLHPLWQTAEQFGAVCTNQIDEQVTHVVANSLGTDKVNWALSTGRYVVHPGWVEASALLYRRANEHDFAIKS
ncbi:hypothetical protein RJ640_011784 [Escallonia rubra]|uniref:protein-serine/threonine phosphatase n=1 Tax=Escallonia rubra TaxID=112253 RepID=A0AA88QWI4_9ASTE|nr:hypothetical protein RJ640_011784 [Escallonia rubra]